MDDVGLVGEEEKPTRPAPPRGKKPRPSAASLPACPASLAACLLSSSSSVSTTGRPYSSSASSLGTTNTLNSRVLLLSGDGKLERLHGM